MKIQHIDGFDVAVRVTGPSHHYLGIAWHTTDPNVPLVVQTSSHSDPGFRLLAVEADPRTSAILEGIETVNRRLSAGLHPAVIRFLTDDPCNPEIYRLMAERLAEHAFMSSSASGLASVSARRP